MATTFENYFDTWRRASYPVPTDEPLFVVRESFAPSLEPSWVRKLLPDDEDIGDQGYGWMESKKGPQTTAAALLTSRSEEETFALWMIAFLRQDLVAHRRQSHEHVRFIENVLFRPGAIDEMYRVVDQEGTYGKRLDYHHLCTDTLPSSLFGSLQFYWPNSDDRSCGNSAHDFIKLCAHRRLLIHAKYGIEVLIPKGGSLDLIRLALRHDHLSEKGQRAASSIQGGLSYLERRWLEPDAEAYAQWVFEKGAQVVELVNSSDRDETLVASLRSSLSSPPPEGNLPQAYGFGLGWLTRGLTDLLEEL